MPKIMHKNGQSIVEFSLIAILVVLGIVFMGPYVLRSINAHFKIWDESVQDSQQEKLTQAPVSSVPDINLTCNCPPDTPGTCVGPDRIYSHSCNPQLCDGRPASYSVQDDTCCTIYYAQACGTIPTNQTRPPDNCWYGQRIQATYCSNLPVKCADDASCPLPQCRGVLSPGALFCINNAQTPPTPLLDYYTITYAGNGNGSCNPDHTINPCEAYCDGMHGGLINPSKTACDNFFTIAPVIPNTRNDQSNNPGFCPGAPVKSVTITDQTNPGSSSGCKYTTDGTPESPQATPNEQCEITLTY